jgi:hypothetical protein
VFTVYAGILFYLHEPALVPVARATPNLRWTAPAQCPDQEYVLAALQRATSTLATVPSTWSAEATVTAHGPREWSVRILFRDGTSPTGERELLERNCRRLADASALIMALSLEEAAEHAPIVSTNSNASPPRPPPVTHNIYDPERPWNGRPIPPSVISDRTAWQFSLGASLGIDVTSLPTASWGAALTLQATHGLLAIEAEVSTWQPQTTTIERARVTADANTVAWRFGLRFSNVTATVGPVLGRYAASAEGIDVPQASSAWLFAVQASVAVCHRPTTSISLCFVPQAWFTVFEPTFTIVNLGTVYNAGSLGFRTFLEFKTHFL